MTAARVLSLRQLNRATLARQLLLERTSLAPLQAIKQVAGLQGQLANPPYIGLWSRLQAFQRPDLTQLLEQRQVVRTSMMRRTLHLTTAEDYLSFRPALQGLHARQFDAYCNGQQMSEPELARVIAEIQAYLQEKPRTNVELRARLAELFPGGGDRLLSIVRIALPLIQVFPGGAWGVGGSPAYTEASSWLGRAFAAPREGLHTLVLSYLAAFGPASVKDIQMWSGLSRLQPVVDELRAELVTLPVKKESNSCTGPPTRSTLSRLSLSRMASEQASRTCGEDCKETICEGTRGRHTRACPPLAPPRIGSLFMLALYCFVRAPPAASLLPVYGPGPGPARSGEPSWLYAAAQGAPRF